MLRTMKTDKRISVTGSAPTLYNFEDARTRTGTRRRLQTRVRRPWTPIQGKRRQYWCLSRRRILDRQVSGTGRKSDCFLSPVRAQRFVPAMKPQKMATCTDMRGSMEKTRRQLQTTILETKIILAPVVILVSQGPQQQGDVRTKHHIAASSLAVVQDGGGHRQGG